MYYLWTVWTESIFFFNYDCSSDKFKFQWIKPIKMLLYLMSVKSSTELMLYVVLTMPTLNKAYLFIYLLEKWQLHQHYEKQRSKRSLKCRLFSWWKALVEQKLPTLPEHRGSHPVFSGVRVTRSLFLGVNFVDRCFSFGHYVVVSSSICGFWLPLWYLQTLHLSFFFCFR